MKNKNLNKAKKLNKKELKVINGGLLRCLINGACIDIQIACAELQCRPVLEPWEV